MSMIWSSRERNRSCSLVSRRSRGRIANLRSISPSEKNQIRGNPHNRICKKIALQQPKTGKFDYLSEPNHPAHSMAFKFFTDDHANVGAVMERWCPTQQMLGVFLREVRPMKKLLTYRFRCVDCAHVTTGGTGADILSECLRLVDHKTVCSYASKRHG